VVEPGRAEAIAQPWRQPAVVAEHHAFHKRAPLAVEAACDRAASRARKRVRDMAEPAARADLAPRVDLKHDMDPVSAEPGFLVEAVLRPARKLHDGEHVEDGALRRSPPTRQLEEHRLGDQNVARSA
jgi:hypothetical protein